VTLGVIDALQSVHVAEEKCERDTGLEPARDRGLEARVFGGPARKSRSARTRSRSTSSRSREANQPRRPPIVAYVRKRSGVESVRSSDGEMFGLMNSVE